MRKAPILKCYGEVSCMFIGLLVILFTIAGVSAGLLGVPLYLITRKAGYAIFWTMFGFVVMTTVVISKLV